MNNFKKLMLFTKIVSMLVYLYAPTILAQIVSINYSGVAPSDISPYWGYVEIPVNESGKFGIPNPERGYQVKAGVFDVHTSNSGNSFFENVTGDTDKDIEPLDDYMDYFCRDGITLVEVEQYTHFTESELANQSSISSSQLTSAKNLFTQELKPLGLKANFVMNSSFKYLPGSAQYGTMNGNTYNNIGQNSPRTNGLNYYMNSMSNFYNDISPYVAVANLGWMSVPYDYNTYKLSGKWNRSGAARWQLYKIADENFSNPILPLKNYHGTERESRQKFDWAVVNENSCAGNSTSDFSKLRKNVIDNVLNAFPHQKILTKSLTPWTTYMLTTYGINNVGFGNDAGGTPTGSSQLQHYDPRKYVHRHFLGPFAESEYNSNTTPTYNPKFNRDKITNLFNSGDYLRVGYYDGCFAGSTYSHAWSIGGSKTQEVGWLDGWPNEDGVGGDWTNQPCYVDPYLLRQYRSNLWMHGDMPIYETGVDAINTGKDVPFDGYQKSSFAHNFRYMNWYPDTNGVSNVNYDYETGEGILSAKLQDGLESALKLRYFNFTSLDITQNNKLDGRSPYEMPRNYQPDIAYGEEYTSEGIPTQYETALTGWRSPASGETMTKVLAQNYGLPVSDRYFHTLSGERTMYEYIRDHLGYRLELINATLNEANGGATLDLSLVNRGFAAPQNPREIYFVILDQSNDIVDVILSDSNSDNDWRDWQPDEFAKSHSNQIGSNYTVNYPNNPAHDFTNSPYNNDADNIIVGGLPLGKHGTQWFKSPLNINYNPNLYIVTSETIDAQYLNPNFKLGIWMPDSHTDLQDDPKYAVKFANVAKYIHCNGVTILMSLGDEGVQDPNSQYDSDGDGFSNEQETAQGRNPYNPIEYIYSSDLLNNVACVDCNHRIYTPGTIDPNAPSDEDSGGPASIIVDPNDELEDTEILNEVEETEL